MKIYDFICALGTVIFGIILMFWSWSDIAQNTREEDGLAYNGPLLAYGGPILICWSVLYTLKAAALVQASPLGWVALIGIALLISLGIGYIYLGVLETFFPYTKKF